MEGWTTILYWVRKESSYESDKFICESRFNYSFHNKSFFLIYVLMEVYVVREENAKRKNGKLSLYS